MKTKEKKIKKDDLGFELELARLRRLFGAMDGWFRQDINKAIMTSWEAYQREGIEGATLFVDVAVEDLSQRIAEAYRRAIPVLLDAGRLKLKERRLKLVRQLLQRARSNYEKGSFSLALADYRSGHHLLMKFMTQSDGVEINSRPRHSPATPVLVLA